MQSTHQVIRGVVLRDTAYKETDKILNILVPGKVITAKARGVLKSGSGLAAGCQLFAYSEFSLYEYGGKLLIEKADPLNIFVMPDGELLSFALAAYVAELAGLFGATDDPDDDRLFRLVLNTLYAISKFPEQRREKIKAAFELRVAAEGGFAPDLDGCAVCRRFPANGETAYFSFESGQVFCPECYDGDRNEIIEVTPRVLAAMTHVSFCELKKLLAFKLTEAEGKTFCELAERNLSTQIELPSSLDYYKRIANSAI